jgi:hypothetical protein
MDSEIRRGLRVHQIFSGACLVAVGLLAAWNVWLQQRNEITVERLNVVERDGRLRMVVSNSARQTPPIINGRPLEAGVRPAGIIFFNDEGDETGGLVFTGNQGEVSSSLTFDQYKQDQVIGLVYGESAAKRSGGLYVWDRAEMPIDELIAKFKAAESLSEPHRKAAFDKLPQNNGARRVFVGKNDDKSSDVSLFDQLGRPRLTLKVDPSGQPTLEFLDAAGNVTATLPAPAR